jgi:hypothetical protein
MPRYYFDIRYDDEPWSDDQDGVDLVGRTEARAEALDLIAGLAKEQVGLHWRVSVRVRDYEPFSTVTLSVDVEPPQLPSAARGG